MKILLMLSYFTVALSRKNNDDRLEPTHTPSREPTHVTTMTPSRTPSRAPSRTPSRTPSREPTHVTTMTPSRTPSREPTHVTTMTPSRTPSHEPTHTPTHVRGSCIHGSGMVTLLSGERVPISNASIGMIIQTVDKYNVMSFNKIKKLPHAFNNEPASFLTITTEENKQLILTPDHLIPKCDHSDVSAQELVLGDCIFTVDGKENILNIDPVVLNGVYTAITNDTYIVVNDIVVSPFSIYKKLIT
jgi:hypothetical protein